VAEEVRLRDGTAAWVWPLLRTDRALLAAEFARLSPESRRRRFLSPVVSLSEDMFDHLVDDVDGVDHVALVLFAENGDAFDPVGIARIARYPDLRDTADLGVTVRDEWQGRGVASALLPALMRHRPEGVERIVTDVTVDNRASVAMLEALGPTEAENTGFGLREVTVDISSWPREPSAALTGLGTEVPEEMAATVTKRSRSGSHPAQAEPGQPAFKTRDQICPWVR
jgi:RimJ/RimL family protein N-acetyltransferase